MTRRQRTKWFGWISAILFAISAVIAFLVGFDKDLLLGAFQMSMIIAAIINFSFGVFAGFFAWFWRWLDGKDSSELTGLFGVKVGIAVFCLLMLISFGLKKYEKPPTHAPVALVLVPFHGFELAMLIFEPIYWTCEIASAVSDYRTKRRKPRDRDWIDRQRRD